MHVPAVLQVVALAGACVTVPWGPSLVAGVCCASLALAVGAVRCQGASLYNLGGKGGAGVGNAQHTEIAPQWGTDGEKLALYLHSRRHLSTAAYRSYLIADSCVSSNPAGGGPLLC